VEDVPQGKPTHNDAKPTQSDARSDTCSNQTSNTCTDTIADAGCDTFFNQKSNTCTDTIADAIADSLNAPANARLVFNGSPALQLVPIRIQRHHRVVCPRPKRPERV